MIKNVVVVAAIGLLFCGCGGGGSSGGGGAAPPGTGGQLTAPATFSTSGTVGQSLSTQLTASGGTAPVGSWQVVSGVPPSGLGVSQNGIIAGTPSASGTSSFTVRVQDSSTPPQTAQTVVTLTISPNASTPAFATKNGMTNLAFTDSGLLTSGGQVVGAGTAGQSFSIISVMGTSSTVRLNERYWVQVAYNCGSMPDARIGVIAEAPTGGGSASAQTFPTTGTVAGSGTFELYMQVTMLTNATGQSGTSRGLRVSLSPGSSGGSTVTRVLTLN
jgi:hypothetical protein